MDKTAPFRYTKGHSGQPEMRKTVSRQSKTRVVDTRFARYKLQIRRSRIHSLGVFALEDIPARKCVIEYTGKRLRLEAALELRPPFDRYLVRGGQSWMIDGRIGGSGAELINHSCDPNLIWKRLQGRLFYWSRRRIRRGEELTLRYAYPYKAVSVPCRCGSPKCRGTLRYLLRS